jgi:hypothetical protein
VEPSRRSNRGHHELHVVLWTDRSNASGSVSGTSVMATKETAEPNHAGTPGGRSVWFRWTAPASGRVVFDTFSSEFVTTLAVYRGTSVSALTPVAANDDAAGTNWSRLAFDAVGCPVRSGSDPQPSTSCGPHEKLHSAVRAVERSERRERRFSW